MLKALLDIIKSNNLELTVINSMNMEYQIPLWESYINLHKLQQTDNPSDTLTDTIVSIRHAILLPSKENFCGYNQYPNVAELCYKISKETYDAYDALPKSQKHWETLFIQDFTVSSPNDFALILDLMPILKESLPTKEQSYITFYIDHDKQKDLLPVFKDHKFKITNKIPMVRPHCKKVETLVNNASIATLPLF